MPVRLPLAPLAEGGWYVAWGGADAIDNYHVVAPDQRFAFDFVAMRNGAPFAGDGQRNEDHYCFGAAVVAPAAGRVVMASDGLADNARPGVKAAGSPPGNHVVIDHGAGAFSLIAHLKAGSVAVGAGQQVRAGERIGACGNSGRSDLPHVHYHLQDAAAYGAGQGLPVRFGGYAIGGRVVRLGEPRRGALLSPMPPHP